MRLGRLGRVALVVAAGVALGRLAPTGLGGLSLPSVGFATGAPAAVEAVPSSVVGCETQFLDGRWPTITQAMMPGAVPICERGFSTLWSPLSRAPLFSAEHLDAGRVAAARGVPRLGEFHAEANVPHGVRAELSDFVGSGYDRGHMAPSGDMPDPASQNASYTLSNVVAQSPENNRGLWAGIEEGVRDLAARDGEVYVVTGPTFDGASSRALRGRVLVPTRLWKAVYDPRIGAGAYVASNAPGWGYEVVSIDDLARQVGVDPFPGLPAATRAAVAALPAPHGHRR